ncbi:hypothetical protein RchiOBHm_Chr4g0402881 [Rosa chinensis]|uniref:Uncharacterized protein n=1 Tax=Rosa chinensis TaxID=74649 RepID=A0A2P6QTE6_ROSCH|nr:hypothetical protein RchiOBHm_Chr4g0402881 [Rosa chinensis]
MRRRKMVVWWSVVCWRRREKKGWDGSGGVCGRIRFRGIDGYICCVCLKRSS